MSSIQSKVEYENELHDEDDEVEEEEEPPQSNHWNPCSFTTLFLLLIALHWRGFVRHWVPAGVELLTYKLDETKTNLQDFLYFQDVGRQ